MADKDTEQYLRKENMPHIWCPGCGNGILMHDSYSCDTFASA